MLKLKLSPGYNIALWTERTFYFAANLFNDRFNTTTDVTTNVMRMTTRPLSEGSLSELSAYTVQWSTSVAWQRP